MFETDLTPCLVELHFILIKRGFKKKRNVNAVECVTIIIIDINLKWFHNYIYFSLIYPTKVPFIITYFHFFLIILFLFHICIFIGIMLIIIFGNKTDDLLQFCSHSYLLRHSDNVFQYKCVYTTSLKCYTQWHKLIYTP